MAAGRLHTAEGRLTTIKARGWTTLVFLTMAWLFDDASVTEAAQRTLAEILQKYSGMGRNFVEKRRTERGALWTLGLKGDQDGEGIIVSAFLVLIGAGAQQQSTIRLHVHHYGNAIERLEWEACEDDQIFRTAHNHRKGVDIVMRVSMDLIQGNWPAWLGLEKRSF